MPRKKPNPAVADIPIPDTINEAPSHNLKPTQKSESVVEVTARQVVDLIHNENISTPQALERISIPVETLRSVEFRKTLRSLIEESYVPADEQRAALRAGRIKAFTIMLRNGLKEQDTGKLKLAAEFSKQIGMDPEIGLNQAPQQVVNIDLRDVRELLENLEPLPGFESKIEKEE